MQGEREFGERALQRNRGEKGGEKGYVGEVNKNRL